MIYASAWHINLVDDLRFSVSIRRGGFHTTITIGARLRVPRPTRQPPIFRYSANDGFPEAIVEDLALSVTAGYIWSRWPDRQGARRLR